MVNTTQQYDPSTIEPKWQKRWEEGKKYKVTQDPEKRKYYLLEMFPYPSGRIHMGHVRNYSIGDVLARFKIMQGYNVMHPMGWDAFGLPAENAALKHRIHPAIWTEDNIEYMKKQLKRMGYSYDWGREISTCAEIYAKWEQWLFLKMYERGLAYKKESPVNWCDSCQTVLANEQVENGRCWRCETQVVTKLFDQWFFKITAYADDLLEGSEQLTGWPEKVVTMQKNWIGKSYGVEIEFPLADGDASLKVFTTRQDTIYGATFMSIAPEHPIVEKLIQDKYQYEEVKEFIKKVTMQDKTVRSSDEIVKEGVFTGSYCINPMTKKKIPVYVANFVLMEYGTGAIMAVPTHDQRDFEFAKKYNIPLRIVIQPQDKNLKEADMTEAFTTAGVMVNSGPFDGLPNTEAMQHIAEYMEKNGIGKRVVHYRLRDWGISRQRYWGNPIPIIYCDDCGIIPVPYKELPVRLPKNIEFPADGRSPLPELPEFVNCNCPQCGGPAKRETDTMDTFVESSWYFERFASPEWDESPFDQRAIEYWMPVDMYIGGIEHAVLHLLYARFFTKALKDLNLVSYKEPFTNLLTQGMVIKDGAKMSKSKGNTVDPDIMIEKYGADTVRLFCLFAAPPDKDLDWNEQGVEGCSRFLYRCWRMVLGIMDTIESTADLKDAYKNAGISYELKGWTKRLRQITHQTIKKVTIDIKERLHFNTAISRIMEMVNELYIMDLTKKLPRLSLEDAEKKKSALFAIKEAVNSLIRLLAPFVPHIAEEMWERAGGEYSLFDHPWPEFDPVVAKEEERIIIIQINGRVRSKLALSADASEEEIKTAALNDPKTKEWTKGEPVKKVILVQNKLVNIVV